MMTPEETWMAVAAILLLALSVACLLRLILTVHRITDPWPTPPSKWQPPSKTPWKLLGVIVGAYLLAGHLDMQDQERFERTEVAQR